MSSVDASQQHGSASRTPSWWAELERVPGLGLVLALWWWLQGSAASTPQKSGLVLPTDSAEEGEKTLMAEKYSDDQHAEYVMQAMEQATHSLDPADPDYDASVQDVFMNIEDEVEAELRDAWALLW